MSKGSIPKRGEIWLVDLDPTIGSEIKKKRPCAIVGVEPYMRPGTTIIVPITAWMSKYTECIWMVQIPNDETSGLDKVSAADASQVRLLSTRRFNCKLGKLSPSQIDEVVAAVVLCVGFEP